MARASWLDDDSHPDLDAHVESLDHFATSAALNNDENYIITSDHRLIAAFGRTFEKLWDRLE